MRVTISSSSNDNIDEKYKQSAIEITSYLADSGCDLNWGSGDSSIMGICYSEFSKKGRNIYGYTTPKYEYELVNLPNAEHQMFDNTFDLKEHIFYDADLIIVLPGGTGSISEFFSYLEEIRSNDKDKQLILYNNDHHFDKTIELINDLVKRSFNNETITNFYKVINSFEEFKIFFEEFKQNKKHVI